MEENIDKTDINETEKNELKKKFFTFKRTKTKSYDNWCNWCR